MPGCIADQSRDREVGASCRLQKDSSENGTSSAGTVRDPQLSLAVSLFLKFNTDALAYFDRSLPDFRNGTATRIALSSG
jgi:hypothetical protein